MSDFVLDLELIWPEPAVQSRPLEAFIQDLEFAVGCAQVVTAQSPRISTAELERLAHSFDAWHDHYAKLLQQCLSRLSPDDPVLSPVSLFGTMDYGRLETAHTRALAWLLNDREHGFGFVLLEALLRFLMVDNSLQIGKVDRVESEFPIFIGPKSASSGKIDVLAEGIWEASGKKSSWRLVIEAKVDAEEGENQLSRYDQWLARHEDRDEVLRILLTPDERIAKTALEDWRPISFIDLAGIFRRVRGLEDRPGYHFLRYYLTGVLRDICDLPVPIKADCDDPYTAVDYLRFASTGDDQENHQDGRGR